jgi:hypothetical protein
MTVDQGAELLHAAARIFGRKGGLARTPKKIAASRENGKKGGRPRKHPPKEPA